MADKGYAKEITKMLIKAEPGLLVCDPSAVARASASCAEVAGCIIASVLAKQGEATYLEVLKHLLVKIDMAARSTVAIAHEQIDAPEVTKIN